MQNTSRSSMIEMPIVGSIVAAMRAAMGSFRAGTGSGERGPTLDIAALWEAMRMLRLFKAPPTAIEVQLRRQFGKEFSKYRI